uniref:DUF4200 domain-containing protein n=1 Tax=Caenorhabditis tropicalis TaxID=1561998 RepID=A0A1I7U4W8_9PELO
MILSERTTPHWVLPRVTSVETCLSAQQGEERLDGQNEWIYNRGVDRIQIFKKFPKKLQRYNPPTTSAQSYCHGCIRQIRKVNTVMREQYLSEVNHQVDRNHMMTRIRDLERQLASERAQKNGLKVMVARGRGEGEVPDQMRDLMKVNEELRKALENVKEEPETFPFDEWKQGFEEHWSNRYEDLKEFAMDKTEDADYYKRKEQTQRDAVDHHKREIHRLKKLVAEKNEMIELLRADEFESFEMEEWENGKGGKEGGTGSGRDRIDIFFCLILIFFMVLMISEI